MPGWGVMLPPERVLSEMRELGLRGSELGALGYLGDDPGEIRALLGRFGLGAVGGFVPVPALHDKSLRAAAEEVAERAAALLSGAGATYFVTAAVVDEAWSQPFELSPVQWDSVTEGLALIERVCDRYALRQVLHPHVGTLVERSRHIDTVLEGSEVALCLDTGHFSIGGAEPVSFAERHGERVELVHLKDVDLSLAPGVIEHATSLLEGARSGLFRPLGRGDVDVAGTVRALEAAGYRGWYVFEQDTTIDEAAAEGADPGADVKASIEYLRGAL